MIEIRPLAPERLDDFLACFDSDAFADNPSWASCYLQHLDVDHNQVDRHTRAAEGMATADAETRSDASTDAELRNGTLGMFLAAGFEEVRRDDKEHSAWVRRRL